MKIPETLQEENMVRCWWSAGHVGRAGVLYEKFRGSIEMKFHKGGFSYKVENAETVGILGQFYHWHISGPQEKSEDGMREGGYIRTSVSWACGNR